MTASGAAPDPADPTRRLVDEALRLVEALRETGRDPAADPAADPATDPAADPAGWGDAHLGPQCRVCPVCRVLATLRAVRPEAVEQLALAAAELARAWREVVAAPSTVPPERGPADRSPVVERIDVTD